MRILLLLLLPSIAFADGETLHVRPAADCANNGDGTAYACAASAGATGAWTGFTDLNTSTRLATTNTAGKVDPGDTLCIHGNHTSQLTYGDGGGAGLGSGSEGKRITLDFDCSDEPGRIDPVSNNYAFYTEQHHLIVNEPRGSGPNVLGNVFYFPSNAAYVDRQITIIGGAAEDCTPATGESCFALYGDNITITGPTCDLNGGGYCVLSDGKNIKVLDAYAYNAKSTCFVMDNTVDGGYWGKLRCVQISSDTGRSCFEFNDQDHASNAVFDYPLAEDNVCEVQFTYTGSDYLFGYQTRNGVTIKGGSINGGTSGITVLSETGTEKVVISGIKLIGQTVRGVFLGSDTANTVVQYSTFNGDAIGIDSFNAGANNRFENNIFTGLTTALNEITGSSNVNRYNLFFGNVTNRKVNGSGQSVDATSITDDPLLDSSNDIDSDSPAWGAGIYSYPWNGSDGACVGSVKNIGATCANPVPYGYTLKPKKRRR